MIDTLTMAIGAALAAIAALVGIYANARADGRATERLVQQTRELNAIKTAQDVEQAVAGNDRADNRAKLQKWGAK
jgi:hypothetical protein